MVIKEPSSLVNPPENDNNKNIPNDEEMKSPEIMGPRIVKPLDPARQPLAISGANPNILMNPDFNVPMPSAPPSDSEKSFKNN